MSSSHSPPDRQSLLLHLAYAEASVMVIETLLHMLVERGVVPLDQVLQTLETSIDTKRTLAADGIHEEISARAAGVLSQMANSLAAGSARLPRI